MANIVIMPRQGQSVESCVITEWKVKPGDAVKKGDILFTYETDKSAFEEKSEFDGTVIAVLAEEGEDVECLRDVCVIGQPGESYTPATAETAKPAEAAAEAPITDKTGAEVKAVAATAAISGKVKISPRAKALALKTNANLIAAVPTGPNGRIIERDVNALLDAGNTTTPEAVAAFLAGDIEVSAPETAVVTVETAVVPAAAKTVAEAKAEPEIVGSTGSFTDYTEVKLSNVRRVIAKAMHASLSEMAQLTLNSSFDATELLEYRAKLKASAELLGLPNITINDMILFAVSRVILNHKNINANLVGDSMRYFEHCNLGVAVDTERGLLVPTIFGADTLTLAEIAAASKKLANAAKSGTVSPDDLNGGTFTVTNLGAMGVESFTPVINPPQTAILGVDCTVNRLRDDGSVYKAMGLSLTFDHRAVDGAPAAKFLHELCAALENFSLLTAK